MIFSQYRDSVEEITACLHAFKPLIKVMEFVGQAGTKGDGCPPTGAASTSLNHLTYNAPLRRLHQIWKHSIR